jgi:N-carbamoyl-L-amino-acid hydrolase
LVSTEHESTAHRLADVVIDQEQLAVSLFDTLRSNTTKGKGIFRDAYGDGENFAHRLVEKTARELGLEIEHDAAANTYMTLPGRDRSLPRVIVGSHLDSVADGGNFDGAAGVVAGLLAVSAFAAKGCRPARDITVMAVRAEESVWFTTTYFGSRAALGSIPPDAFDAIKRVDTGRTLGEHLRESGGDPERLSVGAPYLKRSEIAAFLEVHIEQGPVLESEGLPIGIVTGIRGNYRLAACKIYGEYSHCGGVPRAYRRDSVVAGSDFIQALDQLWQEWSDDQKDMAFTVGKFFTNADQHALTKIAGEVTFSLDVRSVEAKLLSELQARIQTIADHIAERRGVRFDLGPSSLAEVGPVDPSILQSLMEGAQELQIASRMMPSGASHDAAAFARAGVPMGMIFVRNANGSHNPVEKMEISDLLQATKLLTWWLAKNCAA